MTNNRVSRTIIYLLCILFVSAGISRAGDEPQLKAPGQWRNDLKQLVILSRLVASRPSLLSGVTSTNDIHELSAEPFGCAAPDVSECLLSQLSMVLSQQSTGASSIFAATQDAAVQMNFRRATDAWSDKDIENNWDVVKRWTDAIGPAAILIGAIMLTQQKDGNSRGAAAIVIGSGATLILIGNIGTLGQLYGGVNDKQRAQTARKTINKLQDIEASRQAYEDSQLIYGLLDSYSARSGKLLGMLTDLSNETKVLVNAPSSPDRSKRTVELCDRTREVLSSLKEAAGLAADYADQLSGLYVKYQDDVSLPGDKRTFEDARQSVRKFSDSYHEVIVPLLEGVPEELEALQNIKAAVLANSIAEKQYF